MPTTTVIPIAIAPAGLINAFLIITPSHTLLVDCGLPDTEDKVAAALASVNRSLTDICLIIITHAHIDHAGNAANLRELSGANIVAHIHERPYLLGHKAMTFCSTGWFGTMFKKTGAIQKAYTPVEADIWLSPDDIFDLSPYGVSGSIIPTPGHTDGSISVTLDDGTAIVGDLISSGILLGGIACKGRAKRPPFEENPIQVSEVLKSLVARGGNLFYMGHGGPLPSKEVLRHAERLATLKQSAQQSSSERVS